MKGINDELLTGDLLDHITEVWPHDSNAVRFRNGEGRTRMSEATTRGLIDTANWLTTKLTLECRQMDQPEEPIDPK